MSNDRDQLLARGFKPDWIDHVNLNDLQPTIGAIISPGPWEPYEEAIELLGDPSVCLCVLDFGSGLGRNLVGLVKRYFWRVHAYDQAAMNQGAQKMYPDLTAYRVRFSDDWSVVRKANFDAVLATLVFQHIDHPFIEPILSDLRDMTPRLVVHSRWCFDDMRTPVREYLEWFFNIVSMKDVVNPTHEHWLAVCEPRRPKGCCP